MRKRHLAAVACAALAVSCGGETEGPPEAPVPDPGVEAEAAPFAVTAAGRDVRWYTSRGRRALDGLENVVVYRSADDVSGSPDVVLHARCMGDRSEVELDMGVELGDDVVTDGDLRTKRVLIRFVPQDVRPVVFDVGSTGRSVVVDRPLSFLRLLVGADSLVVQTVSRRGTAVFAEFVVSPLAYERLSLVADTCGWILDRSRLCASSASGRRRCWISSAPRCWPPTSACRSGTASSASGSTTTRSTWTCRRRWAARTWASA